jgi:hypothetical protein
VITFRTIRRFLAPRWLTEGDGELVGYSLDLIKDAFLERCRLGMLVRFPQQDANGTPGPTDALDAMGRDRRMVRGIEETDTAYALRMKDWLTDRRRAGNPFCLMKQLAAYCDGNGDKGCSFRTVDNSGNWYSRSSAGVETSSLDTGNWDWDAEAATNWGRFWVIIYPGTRWTLTGQDWGDASNPWGGALATWGSSTITDEQSRTLRALIADWKPGGTQCHTIILAFDPASFDPSAPEPNGTWHYWGNRLTTALYLAGS